MSSSIYEDYYDKIKSLNIKHYAGEVSYYSKAELRPAEKALLDKLPKGSKILDVGCGSGRFSINAALHGFDVTGIDITPEAIDNCIRRASKDNINAKFKVHDITTGPPEGIFDYVFCPRFVINAISTDKHRRDAIESMYKACKPGGSLFIESFNIAYMGQGPLMPLKNISLSFWRRIKIRYSILANRQYRDLLPGDITYKANKVESAEDGYAHLPTIFEIKSYLHKQKLYSIYEITNQKKLDILKPFRYSIWTIDEDIE